MEGWEYKTNIKRLLDNRVSEGWWESSMGKVELVKPDMLYKAWIYLNGKMYRIGECFESASVAMAAVERTWKREEEKK